MALLGALCLLAIAGADAASFGNGASAGAASSSTSFGGVNGQTAGVNYGSTNGYTGTSTYGSNYPYTQFTSQQYSTQPYQNSNYPNNFQNPNQYPNQFPNQFSNQFQNQYQNQYQNPNQFQPAQFQNQFQQQQQQFPFTPFVPIQFPQFFPAPFTPPEYQQAFSQFQNSLQQQLASGGSFAYSTPGASAYALSSLGPNNLNNQQQEAWNQWQNGGGNANSVPYYAPNYAAATASYGNNGIHQTASIYPANPNSPNIDNRFGASGPNDGSGFFGVSTSSFSSSSDVNGMKTNRKGAITSVNDNGKITTYKVGS